MQDPQGLKPSKTRYWIQHKFHLFQQEINLANTAKIF